MISSQVAIAVTLLIGGALLVKSLRQVQHVVTGFDTENLLVMQLSVPVSAYPSPDALRLFYPDLRRRLEALPGVRSVSLSVNVPFGRSRTGWELNIEGKVVPPGQEDPGAGYHNGSESYFRTMGIALQRGRNFDATDVATSPLTAVISDQFAAENWPKEDPLGKRFHGCGVGPSLDHGHRRGRPRSTLRAGARSAARVLHVRLPGDVAGGLSRGSHRW